LVKIIGSLGSSFVTSPVVAAVGGGLRHVVDVVGGRMAKTWRGAGTGFCSRPATGCSRADASGSNVAPHSASGSQWSKELCGIGREATVAGLLDVDGRVLVDKDQAVGDDSEAHDGTLPSDGSVT